MQSATLNSRFVLATLQVLALGDMGATVPDLQAFRDGAEEETFAHDVPPFPIERQTADAPSFSRRGEVRGSECRLSAGPILGKEQTQCILCACQK